MLLAYNLFGEEGKAFTHKVYNPIKLTSIKLLRVGAVCRAIGRVCIDSAVLRT